MNLITGSAADLPFAGGNSVRGIFPHAVFVKTAPSINRLHGRFFCRRIDNNYLNMVQYGSPFYIGGIFTDIRLKDIIVMKKPHPCGGNRFLVTRVGMDFKIRCCRCGHEVMVPRAKAEKNIKRIERENENV